MKLYVYWLFILIGLQTLRAEANQLRGTLPDMFASMSSFRYL